MNKKELYEGKIQEGLLRFLPQKQSNDLAHVVNESMEYSLMCGGKRVRPVLTLAFCELCGGSVERAVPFAVAVEMVHTYSLIHDDMPCMDNDDIRRGRPTNHKVYGESMALLAGDGLLTLAFETALSYEGESGLAVQGAKVLAELAGVQGMVGGQCIDLQSEGKKVDVETLIAMDMGKTAALITAACELGCIAAGAAESLREAARRYAEGLGMAFQIRDDILDVLGDVQALGKNVGVDSQNEKSTYVSLLGVEKSQELVEKYTQEALSALRLFPGDSSFLQELTLSLANRNT